MKPKKLLFYIYVYFIQVECGGCHSMIMAAVKSQNEDLDDHIDEDKDNEETDKLIADYTTVSYIKIFVFHSLFN